MLEQILFTKEYILGDYLENSFENYCWFAGESSNVEFRWSFEYIQIMAIKISVLNYFGLNITTTQTN